MRVLPPLLCLGLLQAVPLASADILYRDAFDLDDGTEPVSPATALSWYGYNSGNVIRIQDKALANNPGANSARGFVGVFAEAVTLEPGESLRLDFKVTVVQPPPDGGNPLGFRFGLAHSHGSVGARTGDSAFNTDRSYFARVACLGRKNAIEPYVDVVKETGSNAHGLLGGTDTVVIAGAAGAPAAFSDAQPRTYGFVVTRTSETAVSIGIYQDGSSEACYTISDVSDAFFTFDEVAIGTGGMTSPLIVDDIVVTRLAAPPIAVPSAAP